MNDTAETIPAHNPSVAENRCRCNRRALCLRWHERQRSMWSVPVVVGDEHVKGPLKVLLVQNQQPVETFRAGGAHEPLANAYAERFIGSVRRECLDHVIVFGAAGLQRLLHLYCAYYQRSRTHLSLNKDAPIPRAVACRDDGRVVAISQVGGLHHRYERHAA